MRVGFVGTGTMGSRFARALLQAGHPVVVHDRRPEAMEALAAGGARIAPTPREVAEGTDVVFGSLPSGREVEAIFLGGDGLLSGLRPGQAYFDLTTSDPGVSRRLAALAAEKGAHFLDAPVSFGTANDENATVAMLVGGDRDILQAHLEVLEPFCDHLFHFGEVGSGNVAKLINNLIAIANRTVACEALVLGTRAGLDPDRLFRSICVSSGNSFVFSGLGGSVLQGRFEGAFTIDLAAKDVALAVDLAKGLQVPLRVTSQVHDLLGEAQRRGMGGAASGSVIRIMEEAAGVEVRDRRG